VDDAEEGDKTESNNTPGSIPGYDEGKDLKDWSKDEVKAWLGFLQKKGEFEFKIEKVACPGEFFAAMTKADLLRRAPSCGDHISNAKEALLRKQNSSVHASSTDLSRVFSLVCFVIDRRGTMPTDVTRKHPREFIFMDAYISECVCELNNRLTLFIQRMQ